MKYERLVVILQIIMYICWTKRDAFDYNNILYVTIKDWILTQ